MIQNKTQVGKTSLINKYPLTFSASWLVVLGYLAFFLLPIAGAVVTLIAVPVAICLSIAGILKEPSKNPALIVHIVSVLSLLATVIFIVNFFRSWGSGSDSLEMM
jgi:hypothetical protein